MSCNYASVKLFKATIQYQVFSSKKKSEFSSKQGMPLKKLFVHLLIPRASWKSNKALILIHYRFCFLNWIVKNDCKSIWLFNSVLTIEHICSIFIPILVYRKWQRILNSNAHFNFVEKKSRMLMVFVYLVSMSKVFIWARYKVKSIMIIKNGREALISLTTLEWALQEPNAK